MFNSISPILLKQTVFDQRRKCTSDDQTLRFIEGMCCFVCLDLETSKPTLYRINLDEFRKKQFLDVVKNMTGINADKKRGAKWKLKDIFTYWNGAEVWLMSYLFELLSLFHLLSR